MGLILCFVLVICQFGLLQGTIYLYLIGGVMQMKTMLRYHLWHIVAAGGVV